MSAYRRFILEKMVKHKWIGGKHTNEENIPKGKPRDEYKKIFDALDELKKEGFFILRKKPDGMHLSINPKMMPRVRQVLEEELRGEGTQHAEPATYLGKIGKRKIKGG